MGSRIMIIGTDQSHRSSVLVISEYLVVAQRLRAVILDQKPQFLPMPQGEEEKMEIRKEMGRWEKREIRPM